MVRRHHFTGRASPVHRSVRAIRPGSRSQSVPTGGQDRGLDTSRVVQGAILPCHRRTERSDGSSDRHIRHGVSVRLMERQGTTARILHVAVNPPVSGHGRVHFHGFLLVFHILGTRADPDVLPDFNMGEQTKQRIFRDEVLDLHGYTQTSTPAAITSFIGSCNNPDNQCVMIITGKGRNSPDRVSVVRTTALETLRKHPRVLAYCCSQPVDGGYGAFYILLRR